MSENIIYCYSGGGNCLDMAMNIARFLGDTDIVMIRSYPAITDTRGAKRVGFIFPCYGGGLPGGVEESVRSVRIEPGTYTFGIAQCAAYMGTGLHTINKIHKLDYWAKATHQSACIWLMPHWLMFPVLPAGLAQKLSEKRALDLADDIKAKRRCKKQPPMRIVNALENKGFPAIAQKISEKYYADESKCVGCGTCESVCPKHNIRVIDGLPKFGNDCIGCLSCIQFCPTAALNAGRVTVKRARYTNPNVTAKDITKKIIHID